MTAAAPQQVLGSYVIERELGRGGMGAIYLGVHQTLGKRVAIKLLLPELSRREDLIARFWAEARAVTAIKHASIVDVYDYGATDDGRTFIVMEYLEGESLGARLKARGLLPIPQAVAIARQIANALAAAHAVGVVHRDLKPDNIFLVDDPEVVGGQRAKLLDFGVAKLVVAAEDTAKTVTGALLGTPHYMSPEQCEGARAVDHRSDLYSLGCTLFQMVSGRLPFESPGLGGLIGMHLHVPPPKLRDRAGHASEALERIVARLLEKQPDARFSSAAEVAAALSASEASEVDAAASAPLPKQIVDAYLPTAVTHQPLVPKNVTTDPPAPPAKRGPRSRWSWLGVSVGLVGTVALVALMSSKDSARNGSGDRETDVAGAVTGGDGGFIRVREVDAAELAQDSTIGAVTRLLNEHKWVEAGLRARELEATGLTSAQIDQILSSSAEHAAHDVEARIEELSGDSDCATATAEAKRFLMGWRRVALRATMLARSCMIAADDPKGVHEEIIDAYTLGQPAVAIQTCKEHITLARELRITCAFIACATQDRLAKAWLAALKKPDADTVLAECQLARGSATAD